MHVLREAWARLKKQQPAPELPGVEFHDRRRSAAQSHHGFATKRRSLTSVTGICLHQTACVLGERIERWDPVGAHIGITRAGKVIWLHSFDRRVVHGNGWNAGTIGIEIDGLYAGVEGDVSTVWNDPSTPGRERGMQLPEVQAEAARQCVRWICEQVPSVRVIVAHRQSSGARRNDPGEAIWKAVALTSGLATPAGFTLDDGRPIPEAWDPKRRGVRY